MCLPMHENNTIKCYSVLQLHQRSLPNDDIAFWAQQIKRCSIVMSYNHEKKNQNFKGGTSSCEEEKHGWAIAVTFSKTQKWGGCIWSSETF